MRTSCFLLNAGRYLALVAIAARLFAQGQSTNAPRTLTVRVRPDVAADTLKVLAQASESKTQELTRSGTVNAILVREYGVSSTKTRTLLQDFNPDIDLKAGPQAVTVLEIPTGPDWRFNVKVPPDRSMTIHEQVQQLMGDSGPKTKEEFNVLNPTLVGKWEQPASRTIVLPYVTGFVTYNLRTDADVAAVTSALARDPAVIRWDLTTGQRLIPSLTHLTGTAEGCIEATQAAVKPYGSHIDNILPEPSAPTTIAIVDSGLARDDHRFDNLWKKSRSSAVDSGPGTFFVCESDSPGCNFVSKQGFPLDDATGEGLASHGTHVAGLASGRLLGPGLTPKIDRNIQLMILKVADSTGRIDSGNVFNAAYYAQRSGVSVVNLSLTGPSEQAIYEAIRTSASILFVVAAGNDNALLQTDEHSQLQYGYPALYGQDLPNIISVAALDQNGERACFSNYGPVVDIAAPGVAVESTVTGGTAMLSGTSQAAPVVSFAAALLLSAGYNRTPAAIKNRLIVSGDYFEKLKDVVASGSRLNIEKALSFRTDVIELTDHSLIDGAIDPPAPFNVSGQVRPILWQNVAKIVVSPLQGSTQSRITLVNNGKLTNIFTDLPISELSGKDREGKFFRVQLRDVIDITTGEQ
jgi:Subtilase family